MRTKTCKFCMGSFLVELASQVLQVSTGELELLASLAKLANVAESVSMMDKTCKPFSRDFTPVKDL